MCSFRGSFFRSGEKRCKVRNSFWIRKIFRDIFFRFRRFSYLPAGFAPDGAVPAEALWRWREPPFPESECKVSHSYSSLQIFQEKFSRKYVVKHVFVAKAPALRFDWQPLTPERKNSGRCAEKFASVRQTGRCPPGAANRTATFYLDKHLLPTSITGRRIWERKGK